jgi:3alpha(or 20beta)-hydroxysteroid dehydrogenase
MLSGLNGKVAIVSGAARGIGASEVRLLVECGVRIVIGDLLDEPGEALVRELSLGRDPAPAIYRHLDATKPDDWNSIVAAAERSFGRLDILINNAGVHGRKGLEETTIEEWHRVIDNDLTTA